ncbi:MAG: selenium metabolism-associated LysR family transcriptional regulator [Thermodesulfobacteriota bacterium]
MDIHHLKIFTTVYKNRSFSRASEELHISQPTISEHIKNLENELDCKLFDRLGRTIIPTNQADLILPKALQVIEEMESIPDLLMEAGSTIRGHIILGASTIPGTYLLPALAARFKEKHPEVSFEILINDTASISSMVVNHEILIGVVGAKVDQKYLKLRPFFEDELICAGTPHLADQCRQSNLAAVPFLQREQGSGTRSVTEGFLKKSSFTRKDLQIAATLGSTAAIKEAMKAGLGISILSKMAILDELSSGSLKEISMGSPAMTRSFYLMRHKKRSLPAHYQAFYDMVSRAYSSK